MADGDNGLIWRMVATLVVIIGAVPGLVFEPTFFSEALAGVALLAIWGIDTEE